MIWEEFLTILVLVFSLVMIVAGIFTAYFGSGKSRKVGVALLIVGAIIGLLWAFLIFGSDIALFADIPALDIMREAIINIIAALIGALVAVGIFLVAVMKS
jgi:hypothetical protein